MSRSFKKNWCSKDNDSKMKKFANRKVRNYDDEIQNGKSYRKIFCSYNISDYKSTCYGKYLEIDKFVSWCEPNEVYKYYRK